MFIDHDEYRRHAANEELYERTAFIQCGNLQKINSEDHYFTYTSEASRGLMCSEPMTFPVRSGLESAFTVDEVKGRLSSFDTLRGQFEGLRADIVYGFDQESGENLEHLNPADYDAEQPTIWMERQRKFFRDAINTDLLFFTDK